MASQSKVEKRARRRREKSAKARAERERRDRIKEHRRDGKKFVAPFNTMLLPMAWNSWRDDRFPELLWVALLITHYDRESAIEMLRSVARWWAEHGSGSKLDPGHSRLAALEPERRREFLRFLIKELADPDDLRPLLLLPSLPAYDDWAAAISLTPDLSDWSVLKRVVVDQFDHQSQTATDCRWIRALVFMVTGGLMLPSEDLVNELMMYPHVGDQRKVRPFIRATEGALQQLVQGEDAATAWPRRFWDYVYDNTSPTYGTFGQAEVRAIPRDATVHVQRVLRELDGHFVNTRAQRFDPRHEVAFGLTLSPIRVFEEIFDTEAHQSVLSVFALRFATECVINLAYLRTSGDEELWQRFRSHGHGQAKLMTMKHERDELIADCIDLDYADSFVSEEKAEYLVDVDMGDWSGESIRERSILSDTNELYDTYYDYASNVTHGSWAGVAPLAYVHNMNPLHRLQRLPRKRGLRTRSCVWDAARLMNRLLAELDLLFPGVPSELPLDEWKSYDRGGP